MLQPFDVLKTRLQDPGKHEPRSLFKVFTGLVKKEGISSLWRGTTPVSININKYNLSLTSKDGFEEKVFIL